MKVHTKRKCLKKQMLNQRRRLLHQDHDLFNFTVSQQFNDEADEVRDTARDSREAGHKESPLINRGDGDAQRKAKDGIIPKKSDQPPSITMFHQASNFEINNANFAAIGGNATIIQFGNEQFTEVQRILIGDYIATLTALPGITDNLKKHILTQLIINLPRAEAVFNDYRTTKKSGPCFEGTRVALLREMAHWATGQDESRMYILSGLAGIGKSTVAYTIASRAADLNLLGSSFFFSRDDDDRNNAKRLFTTIAYQLCVYDEHFAKAIGDVLQTERGSAAVTKGPHEQLQVLILDPLRSIIQSRTRPILVVLDALDECDESDIRAVIQGMSQLVRDLPSFKVILTTRPQPVFEHLLSNHDGHKLFRLQDIEKEIVDYDIRLYLKYNLSPENVKMYFPKRQWHAPSDEQIDELVRVAGQLFIIAATSVRYILDKSASNPAGQMQELLRASAQGHTPFEDLDHFYTVILRNVIPVNCDNHNIIGRYQSVVGAIILVQRPLPISVLACLIEIDEEEIHAVLDHLQSVILLGDDDVPRVYHKSFPDYLTDKARCKDSHLRIDPKIAHTQIATCCLEIANTHLKYNILGLGTPARFMDNEDGLKKDGITDGQLLEKIPEHLRYACVYWVAHLEHANREDSDIVNGLDKFVNRHTLHWFEVLGIIGKLDTAHRSIRAVLKLLTSMSSDLHQLLSEALRFIAKFYEVINRSALHTYYSALPFSPTDSALYHRYIKDAKHGICDVEGGPKKWDGLVAKLNHEAVDTVKFSSDSAMLVTYFDRHGKDLKIWDAFTGTPISSIPGYSFAISNDFSTIASLKDNVITCYNRDGSATGTMVTTSSEIVKIALSYEGNRIAAALSDGTICLWKSTNGKLIDSFNENSGYCYLLQFFSSSPRLVYSSVTANGVVKLRDGITGRIVADLQCGSYAKFEFSANGSRMASISRDSGLKLWNGESGSLIDAVEGIGEFTRALAISENGSLLATGDQHVTLWSENCGQLVEIKVLESQQPEWLTFTLNDKLAISGYTTVEIYNIETQTISTLKPRLSTSGQIVHSLDGTRFACRTLLFDVQAIDTSSSSSGGSVVAMALSRDCSRLSCELYGGMVQLWETSPMVQHIASNYDCRPKSMGMGFVPDGRLFASWSEGGYGTIRLWWGGDGSLFGTFDTSCHLRSVALSNRNLIAVGSAKEVTLWNYSTLGLVHTFGPFDNDVDYATISDQGDLAAIKFENGIVDLFDLTRNTGITTFEFPVSCPRNLQFLPDKSHLVGYIEEGQLLSINLANKRIVKESSLEHFSQLPNIPLWHGVPVSVYYDADRRPYVGASFSKSQGPVPVLWIPSDIVVRRWTQGSTMIALGCDDIPIILLRLRTSHGY